MDNEISLSINDITANNLNRRLSKSFDLNNAVSSLRNYSSLSKKRLELAARCFDLSIEHHHSILVLINSQKYGSANTLLRPLAESAVAGCWIMYCADKEYVDRLDIGNWGWRLDSMISELARTPETASTGRNLKSILNTGTEISRVLDSFTHGGAVQLSRRFPGFSGNVGFRLGEIRATLLIADAVLASVSGVLSVIDSKPELHFLMQQALSECAQESHEFFGGPEPPTQLPGQFPQPNPKNDI